MVTTNKLGLCMIILLLLFPFLVAGTAFPMPISGVISVDGNLAYGAEITLKNTRTKDQISIIADLQGYYLVDWSNHARAGDTIIVQVQGCSGDDCIRYVRMDGDPVRHVSFDLWEQPGISRKYVCDTGQVVSDEDDCPKIPFALKLGLELLAGLIVLASGVLAKFKWGKGFVGLANYYKRLGDKAVSVGDYETAKKNYMRAARMLSTAMSKEREELQNKV